VRATEGRIGRVFVVRLDDGDIIPDCLEKFALDNKITHGQVLLIGGICGGQIVVGPRYSDKRPPEPMLIPVDGAHEVAGIGVLCPGPDEKPMLHIHAALGRAGQTRTGCLRPGVNTWVVGEAVIYEITGVKCQRLKDKDTNFALLEPDGVVTKKARGKSR
jgi:predicted DNA-binding protein with PD1-like motif